MNFRRLLSSFIVLVLQPLLSYAVLNNSQPISTNKTSPATVTWIKITTIDPKSRDQSCKNCTYLDYDDLEDRSPGTNSRRKHRKRRRNKKPIPSERHPGSWNQRRPSMAEHSHKKYSTRVHLDKPAKFAVSQFQEQAVLVHSSTSASIASAASSTSVTSATFSESAASTVSSAIISAPVRYLLPPFVEGDFGHNQQANGNEWMAANGRGSTKFKDTLHYQENELDSFQYSAPSSPMYKTVDTINRTPKSLFRPIVVPPVDETTANYSKDMVCGGGCSRAKWAIYQHNSTNDASLLEFVSPEVARAGMKVINGQQEQPPAADVRQQLIHRTASPSANQWPVSQNQEAGYGLLLEHTTRIPRPFWQPSTQPSFQPTAEIAEITGNYIHDQPSSTFHELGNRLQPPSGPTAGVILDNVDYRTTDRFVSVAGETGQPHELVAQSIRPVPAATIFQNEHSRQGTQHRDNYGSMFTPPTSAAVISDRTGYMPAANKSRPNNSKGLDVAESSYFSDLPSQKEVLKLTQTDVIPGVAGKDYPVYSQILLQRRRFACRGLEGYFADISTRCQVFYICNGNGAGEPMLCPNGTLFSQELLVCDWWYNVDC